VEETLAPGAVVSAVIAPPRADAAATVHLAARGAQEIGGRGTAELRASGPCGAGTDGGEGTRATNKAARGATTSAAAIELEASGVTVRIGDGTSPAMIAAVIRALKAAS
jgi:transposase